MLDPISNHHRSDLAHYKKHSALQVSSAVGYSPGGRNATRLQIDDFTVKSTHQQLNQS